MNLGFIFLTGLTTGGLTCLAIQGGLLAAAMARQVEVKKGKGARATTLTGVQMPDTLWPVIYFLAAKLVAYTLLGLLLGAIGSAVQITPGVQAAMQIIAGLFLLATALNMLNVHPIFRFVAIQPPRFLTRLVRDQARSEDIFAPALLGAMTVFIPCGTTQAMMVLAISSGSALLGALTMFVFILGTSPTFLLLGFVATRLANKRVQKVAARAAAALIVILGLWSVDAGLKLAGAPFAPTTLIADMFSVGAGDVAEPSIVDGVQELTIVADDTGYHPRVARVRGDLPVRLWLVTNNTYSCARAFTIPSMNLVEVLPETGRTPVDLPPLGSGSLRFACSMGMYDGVILVSES